MAKSRKGKVYLVGAGPGDPGLLTVKGKTCLTEADVIVYDHLANPSLLHLAKEDAERIYVGKKGGSHTISQTQINDLIVERARRGEIVVRLKGGDPFIFGRGGEEAEELAEAGVEFQVVPGVSSAVAVPAYAGIPLTHREYTSTVALITGHEDPQKEISKIAWDKLSTGAGTLVFLMGVGNFHRIAQCIMEHGGSGDTAVAVIQKGTIPAQRTVVGQLKNIADLVKENGIKPPAVIVVGDVVQLREKLNWYETRPLFSKRILVTRAREQASAFLVRLASLGAECIEFPTIKVVPLENHDTLDRAIRNISHYQWLIFTSVNGVKYFVERLYALGRDVRDLKGLKIAAIGPKTAEAWLNIGVKPDLVPGEYRAEALIDSLKANHLSGTRILLPRAAKAREILPEELRKIGARVDVVPVYETVKPTQDTRRVKEMLRSGLIDMVTFTSSSTVNNFVEMLIEDAGALKNWMAKTPIACIGPITAGTAREKGFSVAVLPQEFTIEALTQAIVRYFVPDTSPPYSQGPETALT